MIIPGRLTYGPSPRTMEDATVDRRGFLRSLKGAVGWVATAAVAESAAGLPAYRNPTPFIGHADAAGLGTGFRVDFAASAQHQAGLFPQSVAAGDPNPFGAVLWTRIDPEAAGRGRLIVEWQIATAPDFIEGSVVRQGVAVALASGDHEFLNDCHQDFHENTNPPGLSAASPQPKLRQAANQAWAEHGLAAVPFNPDADWSQPVRLYRTFRFGTLADIVVTDERLYRDGLPCGDAEIGERYHRPLAAQSGRTRHARCSVRRRSNGFSAR